MPNRRMSGQTLASNVSQDFIFIGLYSETQTFFAVTDTQRQNRISFCQYHLKQGIKFLKKAMVFV